MTPEDENRALFVQAVAHQQAGRAAEAEQAYRMLLARNPRVIPAHNNLGLLLSAAGRYREAELSLRAALAIRPEYPEGLNNLGAVLRINRRQEEAIGCFRRALALQADNVEALINLADTLRDLRLFAEASAVYERANALRPSDYRIPLGQGRVFTDERKLDQAAAAFARAIALAPDSLELDFVLLKTLQDICDWERLHKQENKVLDGVRGGKDGANPFLLFFTRSTPADQLACARTFANSIKVEASVVAVPERSEGKIRLGYLSSDYRDHPTPLLMAGLIEKHDRTRFEVKGYSIGYNDGSLMRARMEKAFDHFVDLEAMSDEDAANAIAQDRIDILLDVSGYTRYSRPRILAMRAAPIQVNYLAYPGTMGAAFMDYLIADDTVVPKDQYQFYDEKIVSLPDCYQPNDDKRAIAGTTPTRTQCGLPEDAFVFCSFNHSRKITPEFFDIWMNLLREIPHAVLWLYEGNQSVAAKLRLEANARVVDPTRLVFAPRVPLAEHLARHSLADLFLDTLPCNAHTTMSDALWAGLPAITCLGETFAGRVGASLLRAANLEELVAREARDYERMALNLARDPTHLVGLRRKLKDGLQRLPLFDTEKYVHNIENAYLRMIELHRVGKPPESFKV